MLLHPSSTSRKPKQTSRLPSNSPLTQYSSLKLTLHPPKTPSKPKIKIHKYKLPKDFFSQNSFSKPTSTRKRIFTHRQSPSLQLYDQNPTNISSTPKFKQAQNPLPCYFKSTKALMENYNFVSSRNTSNTAVTNIDVEEEIERPLRELSTQLKKIREFSSRRFGEERGRQVEREREREELVGSHRSRLEVVCRGDWENPKKLPPLKLRERLRVGRMLGKEE